MEAKTQEETQSQQPVIHKWIIVIISIVAIIFFIVGLIMNIFMRQQLFLMGLNFIQHYQSTQPNQFVRVIFNLFSILGNTYFIVALLIIIYLVVYRKLLAIVYISYMLACVYVIGILKPSFQEARPFWYTDQINQKQWGCQKQYGFPSGHSLISALLYEPIVAQIILCECLKFPFNKFLLIFPILTSAFIPLSRLYLGSHSTDQIMFGLLISFCALVLYRFILEKFLYRIFQQVINTNKSIVVTISVLVSFVIILMVPIIIYIVNINTRDINQQYLTNIQKVCSNNETYSKIQGKQLQANCFVHLVFGFLFGCIMASSKCFNQYQFSKKLACYFTARWNYVTILNIFFVILLYIILIGPIVGFFFIGLDYFLENSIASYLLKCFAAIIIGIVLLVVIPLLSIKLGIITIISEEGKDSNNADNNQIKSNQKNTKQSPANQIGTNIKLHGYL